MAISRSIPVVSPRHADSFHVRLREEPLQDLQQPFPPSISFVGPFVVVCCGEDTTDAAPAQRIVLVGFGAEGRSEEFRYLMPHGRTETPDQVSAPAVSAEGGLAFLVRRGNRVALIVTNTGTGGHGEVEPAAPVVLAPESTSLALFASGETWIGSWGSRHADVSEWVVGRPRSHRTECLRGPGEPPLWWTDGERVLGVAGEIAIMRMAEEAVAGRLVGRRARTGALAWEADAGAGARVDVVGDLVITCNARRRSAERSRRQDLFRRMRAQRIANDPIGARSVDWREEGERWFRDQGPLPPAEMQAIEAASGRVRFRATLPAMPVGPLAGGSHLVCASAVDEQGVGGIFRFRAADGAEVGRRGFHLEGTFHDAEPALEHGMPELVAADHTHLLWRDGRWLVCEVLADPGREVWRREIGHPPPLSVVAHAGRIYLRRTGSLTVLSEATS